MGERIDFPKRIGLTPPHEQLERLKRMTSTELLACLLAKYPAVEFTFTADEMLAAHGKRVRVTPIGSNEWAVVPNTEPTERQPRVVGSDE